MDFQEIYIIAEDQDALPLYIGFEKDCAEWLKEYETPNIRNDRLAIYLRNFLQDERLLTGVLFNILAQIYKDKDKMMCTDLCLNNMIRGGCHKLGGKNLMRNLCTAVLAINKPIILLYESFRQARGWQIRELTNYSASIDPRHPNNRHKLH